MEESVKLVVVKLTELCQTLGLKATEFYPYVVKQQFIWGISYLVGAFIAAILVIIGYRLATKATAIKDHGHRETVEVISAILLVGGGVILIVTLATFLCQGLGMLLNPHYYAVKHIIELVKPN